MSQRTVTVRVRGDGGQTTSATWGQRAIWQFHGAPDGTAAADSGWPYLVSAGSTVDSVLAAIGTVVGRHQALRTLLEPAAAEPRQTVQSAGELRVELVETTAAEVEEVTGRAWRELTAARFDLAAEWPVRFAVVVADGVPVRLLFTTSRVAIDGHSLRMVVDELQKACTGGEEGPARWQVLDEAAFEGSADGAAVSARAAAYWLRSLRTGPVTMFDLPRLPATDQRFRLMRLASPAMVGAVALLRDRSRLSGSALLLAAYSAGLARWSGHDEVVLQMVAGNRSNLNRKAMVGTLTGQGLFRLPTAGLSVLELAKQAFRASGSAHQYAYCDPDAVAAALAEARLLRGGHLDVAGYVNDALAGEGTVDPPGADELPGLLAATRLEDMGGFPQNRTAMDVRLMLATEAGPDMPVSLLCDTTYVPPEAMRVLLAGIERLIVAAALDGDVEADRIGEVSGVPVLDRGPGWVRCGGGWVDLPAARALWREVLGAGTVVPVPDPDGGDPILEGVLVAGPDGVELTAAHTRLVEAIGRRGDVRAPDRYRVVAADPDDPDLAGWSARPVLATGTGRPG